MNFEGEILTFCGSGKKLSREGFEKRTWPDDCPACGKRMEFEFEPVTARICGCGMRVTARAVMNGGVPVKRRRVKR